MEVYHPRYTCTHCDMQFLTVRSFFGHMRSAGHRYMVQVRKQLRNGFGSSSTTTSTSSPSTMSSTLSWSPVASTSPPLPLIEEPVTPPPHAEVVEQAAVELSEAVVVLVELHDVPEIVLVAENDEPHHVAVAVADDVDVDDDEEAPPPYDLVGQPPGQQRRQLRCPAERCGERLTSAAEMDGHWHGCVVAPPVATVEAVVVTAVVGEEEPEVSMENHARHWNYIYMERSGGQMFSPLLLFFSVLSLQALQLHQKYPKRKKPNIQSSRLFKYLHVCED